LPKDWIQPRGLSKDNIIGDIKQGVSTRRRIVFCEHVAFVSQIELKNVNDALNDSNWIVAMQDELKIVAMQDETYAPVARLEAVRLLLAYACMCNFKLHQMDVKSAFLNGFLNEEVYVSQPPGFEDHLYLNHVFKLKKALYGLKQAPRQWYERLSNVLREN